MYRIVYTCYMQQDLKSTKMDCCLEISCYSFHILLHTNPYNVSIGYSPALSTTCKIVIIGYYNGPGTTAVAEHIHVN